MPFDPDKIDPEFADLFYHGRPTADGTPVGLSDSEWDAQRALLTLFGDYPFTPPVKE